MNKFSIKRLSAAVLGVAVLGLAGVVSQVYAVAPPSRVAVVPASVSDKEALIEWDGPAKDAAQAAYYKVYVDGKQVGSTDKAPSTYGAVSIAEFRKSYEGQGLPALKAHTYKLTDLAPNHTYNISVKSVSDKGVISKDAAMATVTTTATPKTVNILSYGAVGDDKTMNTKAIQQAIDAVPEGGVVEIPKGTFLSGALFVKNNMTIHLDKGAVLKESANPEDLKLGADKRYHGLINADNVKNLRIVGSGTIDGNGWKTVENKDEYMRFTKTTSLEQAGIGAYEQVKAAEKEGFSFHNAFLARSSTLKLNNVENVYIDGVTLRNPALHMIVASGRNVTLYNTDIHTYNTNNGDGIDFTGQHLLVDNSRLDTGDDAVDLSAGFGLKAANKAPTSDIRVYNTFFRRGHGGMAVGSHTGSWIQDIHVADSVFDGTDTALRLKTGATVGGGARNVTFDRNIVAHPHGPAISLSTTYRDPNGNYDYTPATAPGRFYDVNVENSVIFGNPKYPGVVLDTTADNPFGNVVFKDVTFKNTGKNIVRNAGNIKI